nr:PREDICTED: HEAT repeat-containing protein 1 [Latimeria chalumnae]|eukprot:XP_014340340.1 PREDICTED: HEAT repeat-containing protein 1 [Latimeria chalumnae]
MTSLAHQLKRLALPQNDPSLLFRKETASLLFEPKEAANLDRDTFFAIGCTGLDELIGLDASFEEFQSILFSQSSKSLERSVQTKLVNQQLDDSISLFLTRVSPYFMLKPAHKCLEWLIHRFHIHLYNQDGLIGCVLPYHETRVFVRVIQLLKISDPTHRWNWLELIQKPGIPLARGTLITHCYKDLGFMDFICSLVTKAVKVCVFIYLFIYETLQRLAERGLLMTVIPQYYTVTILLMFVSAAQLRVLFSFYASTIVCALDAAEKITDTIIAKLLPYIQKGLKSPLPDYRAATFMIVCELGVKVVLEASLLNTLTLQICKSLAKTSSLLREGLGCLIVLLQNQKGASLGEKPFGYLCRVAGLVTALQGIAATHDIGPFLQYLLPYLVCSIMAETATDDEQPEEAVSQTPAALLEAVLSTITLENNLDHTLANTIIEQYISYGTNGDTSPEKMSVLNRKLLPLVRLFESKYPKTLDVVLEGHLKNVLNQEEQDLFHQFISLSMSSGKYQLLADSDTSLLLSLNHPQPAVRRLAVQHLEEVIRTSQEGFEESFLQEAVLARLKDDCPEVILPALQALQAFSRHLGQEATVTSLLGLFKRVDLSKDDQWYQVLEGALKGLTSGHLLAGNEKLLNQVVMDLLNFMAITVPDSKSAEFKLAVSIANSGLCSLHPLLEGWPQALQKIVKSSKANDILGVANQRLIQILAGNLSAMEPSTMLQMVDELIEKAECECSTTGQKVAFHLICSALLQNCSALADASHLQTALKIYSLLERKIKKMIKKNYNLEVPSKWFPDTVEGSSLPVQLLTDYIRNLSSGQTVEEEHTAMMLLLLKSFIGALKPPTSFPKTNIWWNPESLDVQSCDYLHLLIGLFDLLVCGSSEGNIAISFRKLMQLLFKVHLQAPEDLFRFFSVLWSYSYNHANQLGCTVNAVLQTQAFYIGQVLLAAQTVQKKKQLASPSSPATISLIINLSNPVREVRRGAAACLQVLSGVESPFSPIIDKLVHTVEELIADPVYLSQALGSLFEELQAKTKQKSHQKKLSGALEHLLACVRDSKCPSYIARVLLKTLEAVNSEVVLGHVLPVMERLLQKAGGQPAALLKDECLLLHLILGKYDEDSAPLLGKEQQSFELFITALTTAEEVCFGLPTFQIIALEQITKPFFAALPDGKLQQRLLGVLFNLLVDCKNPLCAQAVNSAFKGISVDAEQVAVELGSFEKAKSPATVQQTRRQKMQQQRKPQEAESATESGTMNWQRITLILELLQHKKKLKRPQALVPALFNLLARCLEPTALEQENLEYTKQLVLSCLLNICQKLSPDGGRISKDVLDKEKFNVELIVHCVRVSDVPQTHHHALLLLGAAAGMFPDKVLHNIMPIFTFMGANVMRLDDAYSFQVINKTVQTVIPALIQAEDEGSLEAEGNIESVVVKITHVFVDALPHVPEHRRLPLLAQLVNTVGAERFLWILPVLLFKQHVTKTTSASAVGDKDSALEGDISFWISVCCEFKVQEQLQSLVKILQYLASLPENKEEDVPGQKKPRQKKSETEATAALLFNVESHSSKQLRHFKFLSVSFMARLLASHSFVGKVAACDEMEQEGLQQLEQRLLEEVLCYINVVARSVEVNADQPTAKFWRALLNKSYDVLDKVNALLPTESFIPVIRGLMGNPLSSVRRKAMDLLNNKLQQRTQWQEKQAQLLLELVGELLSIAQHKGKEEEEQAINRQTALFSLKLLCKCFGARSQDPFLLVLSVAVDLITTEGEEKNVLGSALLCIAEVTSSIKALAIPQLPRLMPAVLKILKNRQQLLSDEIYLLSAVTALQRMTETLPHFISPYLLDILTQVTHLAKTAVSMGPSSQLNLRMTSLQTTLATKLPPRVLLPAVAKCYNKHVDSHQGCLGPLMEILQEHIAHLEKEQLSSHQSELTTFFLKALDFRAEHSEDDLEKVGDTEGHVINCLLTMIMKLSEVTFRPLFFQLFNWSKTEGFSKDRLLTFCRLTDCIAEKLKGLFIFFAGHLVKPFADILVQTNTVKTDDAFFDSENNTEKSCLLLQFVIDCLHKIFLHDTQRFVSKERAETLMMPLVDQLENMLGGEENFQKRTTEHLIPCIGQFSVAIDDDSLWKPLNYQILLKMRDSSPKVRFAALIALLELAGKLRENYTVLLPESIPFLAELMEDESEEVEHQCQKVVQQLEIILGESLQSYF